MKNFIVGTTLEALFLGSLAAWVLLGIDGAGNLFKFMAWASVIVALIQGWTNVGRESLRNDKRSPARIVYMFVRNLAVICVAAWLGMYFLATMWAFSWLLIIGARASKAEVQS